MTKPMAAMPAPDYLSIAVRTYADHGPLKVWNQPPHIGSKYALVFDCETFTDETQALRFGSFQLCEDEVIVRRGLFYDPNAIEAEEVDLLKTYAQRHGILNMSQDEFIEGYIYKFGYELGAVIIGFNLPFDLSRIAKDWGIARKAMKGGFTLRLSDDKRRPNIAVKHLSSRMALIRFVGPFVQRMGRGMRWHCRA